MALKLLPLLSLAVLANAHMAAFHKAMYCLNGTTAGQVNYNNNDPVSPLWMLTTSDWWFHHFNKCDEFPPAEGDFLELPAGESFTVEIAGNRGVTSLSYDGQYATAWGDGQNHPDDFSNSNCITNPNLHTQNQSMAAGTAFAISYESDISKVTMENLAVFTVRYNTPWKLVTSYDVPKDMPACPADGCTCAWVWIPDGCGEPNIYMQGFKCMVTGATSTTPIATAKAPVWCEEDQSTCTQGAKQILIWNQAEGNNIVVSGNDQSGHPKNPAYNSKCGFSDGAQNDIFGTSSSSSAAANAIATPSAATLVVPSVTSTSTLYSTTMIQASGAAGSLASSPPSSPTSSPASSPACGITPSNTTSDPYTTATPSNSSYTTSTSSPTSGPAYGSTSSPSVNNLVASTSSSDGASPSNVGTCRRRKRMVHKRSHRFLF